LSQPQTVAIALLSIMRNTKLFELGRIGATHAALNELERAETLPAALLSRHAAGDFGAFGRYAAIALSAREEREGASATSDDAKLNAWGVRHAGRIISKYVLHTGAVVWIITESDRSATTILLPEEY